MRCWRKIGVGGLASVLVQRARSECAHWTRAVEASPPTPSNVVSRGGRVRDRSVAFFTFSFCLFPLAFFAVATLSSCALWAPKKDVQLKQATAEELTALLRGREASVQTMKGLFSAKIKGGLLPIAQRVEGTMFYRRPDAMRLQGFTSVGSELFEFVMAQDEYILRLPTMGRVFTGRPSEPEQMGKLTRPFQLSVWAMHGVVGAGAVGKQERVALAEEGDRYRLDVFAASSNGAAQPSGAIRRIWFDRQTLLVVREDRLTPTGEVEARLQFDDYRPVGLDEGVVAVNGSLVPDRRMLWPFKVSMEDGQGQGSVQVTFHEIVPNTVLKPGDLGKV